VEETLRIGLRLIRKMAMMKATKNDLLHGANNQRRTTMKKTSTTRMVSNKPRSTAPACRKQNQENDILPVVEVEEGAPVRHNRHREEVATSLRQGLSQGHIERYLLFSVQPLLI
jgi:hypothetical protein